MRQESKDKSQRQSPAFVIAMIGPVGAGKTFIGRLLARRLGARVIRTDDIRVALRRRGEPEERAIAKAHRLQEHLLARGASLVLDHDVVNPVRRRELRERLRPFGVKLYFIKIGAPEHIILARLKRKRYTGRDLFKNAEEAIRVYRFRKKFHDRPQKFSPDFTIDSTKPLGRQITKVVEEIEKVRR